MHRAMYAVLGLGLAGTVMPTAIDSHHRPQQAPAPAVAKSAGDAGSPDAALPASLSLEDWLARGERRLHCLRARTDPACPAYASRD